MKLPIDDVLPAITTAVGHGAIVLEAPPGAGKTTRVPPRILEVLEQRHSPRRHPHVWVLEPRRLAARLAAIRVAEECGDTLGDRVGYTVRFDDKTGRGTRLRYLTTGVALQILTASPTLPDVDAVIFDEIHERQLEMDLILCWVKHLRATTRPDLVVVAMSATLDAEPIAEWLDARRIRASGRAFPVDVTYAAPQARASQPTLGAQVARAVESIPTSDDGDVLVFLPGIRAIEDSRSALTPLARRLDLRLTPLHASLGPDGIRRALRPDHRRQVLLSTNIAESSVTLPRVRTVIDSGLARIPRTNPWTGLLHLDVGPVAQDSAIQRTGRAGRTASGRCIRLYPESDFRRRPVTLEPAIRRMDLTATVLTLATLGVRQPTSLPWLTPPDAAYVSAAQDLLRRLEFIAPDGGVTMAGQAAARLPCHPRLARVLQVCAASGRVDVGARTVALLSDGRADRLHRKPHPESDVLGLLEAHRQLAGDTRRHARDLARRMRHAPPPRDQHTLEETVGQAMLAGFPDRLCRRQGGRRLARVDAGVAELSPDSTVSGGDWLVGIGARPGSPPRITLASRVESDWLWDQPGADDDLSEAIETTWDPKAERVRAHRVTRYRGLPLERESIPARGLDETATLLEERLTVSGFARITDAEALRRLRRRCYWAHEAAPEMPSLDDQMLWTVTRQMCSEASSFKELTQLDLMERLLAEFTWPQRQRLDALVPLRVNLANGRHAKVLYPDEGLPRVSVRMQYLLGTTDGPRLGGGRIPVLLELLAPNQRPVQVTDDLAGFWERTWPAVRKELRGRYPKHDWPEDPTVAPPPRPRRKR